MSECGNGVVWLYSLQLSREKVFKYILCVTLNWIRLHILNENAIIMAFSLLLVYSIWNIPNFIHSRMLLFSVLLTVGFMCCWPFLPSYLQHLSSVLVHASDIPSPVFIHSFIYFFGLAGLRPSLLLSALFMLLGAALRSVPLADLNLKRW